MRPKQIKQKQKYQRHKGKRSCSTEEKFIYNSQKNLLSISWHWRDQQPEKNNCQIANIVWNVDKIPVNSLNFYWNLSK